MITIIDYGAGNLKSISNMLRALGVTSRISSNPKEIASASKLILPGVGHFDFGMVNLRQSKLIAPMTELVLEKRIPFLGICLGAQLLTRRSDEGREPGLGWIPADTRKFDFDRLVCNLRVPHMGWSDTYCLNGHSLFAVFQETPRFYYVHSYHMVCDSAENELCYADYGYRFVSGLTYQNIFGVQFHPEKSHRFGKQLLKNFIYLPSTFSKYS